MRSPYLLLIFALVLFSTGCSRSLSTEELLTRAATAIENGDLASAEVDIKNLLQREPTNARARSMYGEIYLERLDSEAALDQFERSLATEQNPKTQILFAEALLQARNSAELVSQWEKDAFFQVSADPEFQSILARALLAQQDFDRARQALAASGGATSAFAGVTQALFAFALDKEEEKARSILMEVTERDPDFAQAWRMLAGIALQANEREAAIDYLGRSVEANPYRLADRIARVKLQIEVGKADEAEPDLVRLEKMLPNNPAVEFLRGRVLFDDGNYEDAIDMLSRTLGTLPDHPGALLFSSAANAREGNFELAQQQLLRYRRRNPSDEQAALMLASIAIQLQDPRRAEEIAREVYEENPMNTRAIGILAAALAAQGMSAESAQFYGQLASQAPESSVALTALGSQEVLAGDERSGLANLEAAIALESENWAARERLIEALLSGNRYEEASNAAEEYIAAGGGARALVFLGRTRMRQDRPDDARKAFEEALATAPGDPLASASLASLLAIQGDTAQARQALETSLEQNPGHVAVSMALAALQEGEGDLDGLAETLGAAVAANPTAVQPRVALARFELQRNSPEDASALLTPLADSGSDNPVVLDLLVRAYLSSGEYEAAENYVRRLLAELPEDVATRILAGQVYIARGRLEVAENHLRDSREDFPDDVTLHKLLIESLTAQNKLELASEEIALLSAEVQSELPVVVLRARLALSAGDTDTAIELFSEAFSRSPSSYTLGFLAGAKWSAGDREGAMAELNAWLEDNPDDVGTLTMVADREMELGYMDEARGHYGRVIALQPRNILALNNLAWLLKDVDSDKALEYVQTADELAPNSPAIKDTYAMIELGRGNVEGALRLNDAALESAGNAPELLYNRAQILLKAGREGEAKEMLAELVAGPAFSTQAEAAELLSSL